MIKVILHKGREKSLLRRHPWIYSGAVMEVDGAEPGSGETVCVCAADGTGLGCGAWSPASQIRIRMWTFSPEETIDADFFRRRIHQAAQLRQKLNCEQRGNSMRLVYGESDGLPGVVVDRYDRFLVGQFLSAGAERWKNELVAALQEEFSPDGIWERSDTSGREREGLPPKAGLLQGQEPPSEILIKEQNFTFAVDVRNGHKTGFYLDQRDSRQAVAAAASGCEVLNCFSYTGAFSAWALQAGAAKVTDVDTSAPALELAAETYRRNGFDTGRVEQICADVFQQLRKFRDAARSFDLIILDPPKFAETQGQLHKAARAYKDINLLAFKLLRPGGRLFTFSCSGAMTPELFRTVVSEAAVDARRQALVVRTLAQAADHPIALNFPESYYLKGLECLVP